MKLLYIYLVTNAFKSGSKSAIVKVFCTCISIIYFILILGNLARVEEFKGHSDADWREFDLWVSSDCEGTEFANANRSWFYFSVAVPQNYVGRVLRYNKISLNIVLSDSSCYYPVLWCKSQNLVFCC